MLNPNPCHLYKLKVPQKKIIISDCIHQTIHIKDVSLSWKSVCPLHTSVFVMSGNATCSVWWELYRSFIFLCVKIKTSTTFSIRSSSSSSWPLHESLQLLDDWGQTLFAFLAIFSLCVIFLLRLDDDVDRPLSTTFLLLGIFGELALILTHLLLGWGADGPQTLGGVHLRSCYWSATLQLVSCAFWADPLDYSMETKVVKYQLLYFSYFLCVCF